MTRSMRYRLLATLALAMLAGAARMWAIPAYPARVSLTQSDGSTVEARLKGDEHFHFYQTDAGDLLVADGDGIARPISADEVRRRWTARRDAHRALRMRSAAEFAPRGAKSDGATPSVASSGLPGLPDGGATASTGRRAPRRVFGQPTTQTGSHRGLVLVVTFADYGLSVAKAQGRQTSIEDYREMFNMVGYTGQLNLQGSVHDYFYAQSYGKFDMAFDVVGPIQLSQGYAYYGANDDEGNDKRAGEMVAEACRLADPEVDFTRYDWDGDGEVDLVYVITAGYGEHYGASTNWVWAHEYDLYSASMTGDGDGPVQLDGVWVNTYATSSERAGSGSSWLHDGIGTPCHEFSHCLGLPDAYDTDPDHDESTAAMGMGEWSLMDGGGYNGYYGLGECPIGYSAYERWFVGWLEPELLAGPRNVSGMKALSDTACAYVIYNDAHPDEFYMLENRQQRGWDSYIRSHGMLVTHIDYDFATWNANRVNVDAGHPRYAYVSSDPQHQTDAQYTTFPGRTQMHEFTDASTPASTLYHPASDGRLLLGKPIRNIEETHDGQISFKFRRGYYDVTEPTLLPPTDVGATEFTARWEAVPDAESYIVELTTELPDNYDMKMLYSFNQYASQPTADGKDGNTDIGAHLDDYNHEPGWQGYKVFRSAHLGYYKLGTATANGYLLSPLIGTPPFGAVTAGIWLRHYGDDLSGRDAVQVSLLDAGAGTVLQTETVAIQWPSSDDPEADSQVVHVSFYGIEEPCRVKFTLLQRAYVGLTTIYVYDSPDAVTFEDISEPMLRITGLEPDQTYYYRVCAAIAGDRSPWSPYSEAIQTAPSAIEAVKADPLGPIEYYTPAGVRVAHPEPGGLYIRRQAGPRR